MILIERKIIKDKEDLMTELLEESCIKNTFVEMKLQDWFGDQISYYISGEKISCASNISESLHVETLKDAGLRDDFIKGFANMANVKERVT